MIGRVSRIPHAAFLKALAVAFAAIWLALAIAPIDRATWAMENVLVVLLVIVLYATRRRFPLSRVSYSVLFVFLCLHSVGAHYTYSKVPYDAWIQAVSGHSLDEPMGWERNHYDRLVHFSYGFLCAYPIRELFFRVAHARGLWSYLLPLDVTMSTSMLFELFEWWVVVIFGDMEADYLGMQGDPWDAHMDMLLASLGALLAMLVILVINRVGQVDFAREWNESLRVDRWRPLGEDELSRRKRRRGGTEGE